MTDGHMADGHLTDEQLSSQLDGESGFEADGHVEDAGQHAAGHLAGCARCRVRMAALEATRDLVRTPVRPVPPKVRAESIASVLRRSEEAPLSDGVEDAGRADDERLTTAGGLTSAGRPSSTGGPTGGADGPTALRSRMRQQVLVGSAAAVLILATAVAVPLALSGRSTSGGSAESSTAQSATRASAGHNRYGRSATATTGLSKHATASVVDLGPLDSADALRARADSLQPLHSPVAPNAAPVTSAPGPEAAQGSSGEAASASPIAGAFSPGAVQATVTAFERCFSSAAHAAGTGREAQALATTDFKGTPALVYVFMPTSSGSATGNAAQSIVVVTARTGCRVLVTTSL